MLWSAQRLHFQLWPLSLPYFVLLLWAPKLRKQWMRIGSRILGAVGVVSIIIPLPIVILGVLPASGNPPTKGVVSRSPGGQEGRLNYNAGFLGRDFTEVVLRPFANHAGRIMTCWIVAAQCALCCFSCGCLDWDHGASCSSARRYLAASFPGLHCSHCRGWWIESFNGLEFSQVRDIDPGMQDESRRREISGALTQKRMP
jgi:hypothetical protein